jgi:hypothetical protein
MGRCLKGGARGTNRLAFEQKYQVFFDDFTVQYHYHSAVSLYYARRRLYVQGSGGTLALARTIYS